MAAVMGGECIALPHRLGGADRRRFLADREMEHRSRTSAAHEELADAILEGAATQKLAIKMGPARICCRHEQAISGPLPHSSKTATASTDT